MEISFIGVGVMGGGMCRNLLKKGLEVRAIARKKEHLIPFQLKLLICCTEEAV